MNKLATILPGGRVRLRDVEPTMQAPATAIDLPGSRIAVQHTVAADPTSPVRMTIAGEGVGIFASARLAAQTVRMLTRCLALVAALAFGGEQLRAASVCPFEEAPVVKVWPAFEFSLAGSASWSGEEQRGRPMANGAPFDPARATAAMDGVPLGSFVCVRAGARSVWLRVTDRIGPRVRSRGHLVHLSAEAFRQLAPLEQGRVDVRVEVLWRAES